MTTLMHAVKNNDIDAPLIIAAYKRFTEIVKLLLEAGADVSVVDPGMKATALHAAAYAGNAEAARLLIKYNIDIDKQGPYNGCTALHDAVWQNHIETARILIEAGANLHIKSHTGETLWEFAKSRNHREIMVLIEQKIGPTA